MTTRRTALGRGLGALIPTQARAPSGIPALAGEPAPAESPVELPIERIRPNPDQPRRRFDPAELERLAESIRRHGVLQPVVVRQAADAYELVVGERRWRAAQMAGRDRLPVVVADVDPRERLEWALIENVQRHDLNPIELAHAFQTLAAGGATQAEIGERVGFDRSTVANHVRLLELGADIQADVEAGALSLGHAKALLSVASPERRRSLRERILRDQLSVRAAEEAAQALGAVTRGPRRASSAPIALDADSAGLVDTLRSHLKTQVRIRGSAARGRIEIDYFGPEELHRISEIILDSP